MDIAILLTYWCGFHYNVLYLLEACGEDLLANKCRKDDIFTSPVKMVSLPTVRMSLCGLDHRYRSTRLALQEAEDL